MPIVGFLWVLNEKMSITCLAQCLKYKCSINGSLFLVMECRMCIFGLTRMEVCLQYWIRWTKDIEKNNWGYRKGWLKWWVLGIMLCGKLKGKKGYRLQEKGVDVHKYILNIIQSCFMKISHIARSCSHLLFF